VTILEKVLIAILVVLGLIYGRWIMYKLAGVSIYPSVQLLLFRVAMAFAVFYVMEHPGLIGLPQLAGGIPNPFARL
jgi:hypothetical protein